VHAHVVLGIPDNVQKWTVICDRQS
jgi:hypothetical protein